MLDDVDGRQASARFSRAHDEAALEMLRLRDRGLSVREIARVVGKARSGVARTLALIDRDYAQSELDP